MPHLKKNPPFSKKCTIFQKITYFQKKCPILEKMPDFRKMQDFRKNTQLQKQARLQTKCPIFKKMCQKITPFPKTCPFVKKKHHSCFVEKYRMRAVQWENDFNTFFANNSQYIMIFFYSPATWRYVGGTWWSPSKYW